MERITEEDDFEFDLETDLPSLDKPGLNPPKSDTLLGQPPPRDAIDSNNQKPSIITFEDPVPLPDVLYGDKSSKDPNFFEVPTATGNAQVLKISNDPEPSDQSGNIPTFLKPERSNNRRKKSLKQLKSLGTSGFGANYPEQKKEDPVVPKAEPVAAKEQPARDITREDWIRWLDADDSDSDEMEIVAEALKSKLSLNWAQEGDSFVNRVTGYRRQDHPAVDNFKQNLDRLRSRKRQIPTADESQYQAHPAGLPAQNVARIVELQKVAAPQNMVPVQPPPKERIIEVPAIDPQELKEIKTKLAKTVELASQIREELKPTVQHEMLSLASELRTAVSDVSSQLSDHLRVSTSQDISIEKSVDHIFASLTSMTGRFDSLGSTLDKIEHNSWEPVERITAWRSEIDKQHLENLEVLKQSKSVLHSFLNDFQSSLRGMSQELRQNLKKVNDLEVQKREMQSELDSATKALAAQKASWASEQEALARQLRNMHSEKDKLAHEIESNQEKLGDVQTELSRYEEILQDRKASISEIAAREEKLNRMREEAYDAKSDARSKMQEILKLKDLVDREKMDLLTSRQAIQKEKLTLDSMRRDVQDQLRSLEVRAKSTVIQQEQVHSRIVSMILPNYRGALKTSGSHDPKASISRPSRSWALDDQSDFLQTIKETKL